MKRVKVWQLVSVQVTHEENNIYSGELGDFQSEQIRPVPFPDPMTFQLQPGGINSTIVSSVEWGAVKYHPGLKLKRYKQILFCSFFLCAAVYFSLFIMNIVQKYATICLGIPALYNVM